MEPMNGMNGMSGLGGGVMVPGRKKVLTPVSYGAEGQQKTRWVALGIAFVNKDASINIYLDAFPVNGKLQLREWDDTPWEQRKNGVNGTLPPGQQRPLLGDGSPPGPNDLPF
jgi:hypothetical protein